MSRIIINTISLLSPLTGVGNYTYQIAKALKEIDEENEYIYFYRFFSNKLYHANLTLKIISKFPELIPGMFRPLTRKIKKINLKFSQDFFDIYFEPNFIPIDIHSKYTVVTVHDFSFELYPNWHPIDRVHYFKTNFWESIKRADKIIVGSDFVKDIAIKNFSFSEEKVKVIYYGYDRSTFKLYSKEELKTTRKKYKLPNNFLLYVGSIEPRKNIKNLLLAYNSLGQDFKKNYKLVIVGFSGWRNEEVMKIIKSSHYVYYLGYVSREDLGKIYNLADVFVYPSYHEGFGLPALEAMACGCPTIVSNTSSLPEICGDSGLYVNPYDPASIARRIYEIVNDEKLRGTLRKKGLERAQLFSWEKSAREHLDLFRGILNNGGG